MKIARVDERACIVTETGGVDIEAASAGRFSSDIDEIVADIAGLADWFATADVTLDPRLATVPLLAGTRLGPPIVRPPQIFAIGLNYADHAAETGLELPDQPMVFTKFASSLAGAKSKVELTADTTDWEVELVAVIGRAGRSINKAVALDHVAGFCVGQDISERRLQMASTPAQFSLAKSLQAFSPIGPWITTLDELADPLDLAIECRNADEVLQSSRTTSLIFDVPTLIEYLSSHIELRAGDLIFTGTPDGVGVGRRPRQFIEPGWTITSTIEGLGSIESSFTG